MAGNKSGTHSSLSEHRLESLRESASRPPPSRRDPRTDPDDEELPARIEVVTLGRSLYPAKDDQGSVGSRSAAADTVTDAALVLRRELAKLQQQAAAVERTIEDQRRERSDALERIEQATSHAIVLEHRLEQTEAELAKARRQHEAVREELQAIRTERDGATRAAAAYEAELAELRKRAQEEDDRNAELRILRDRVDRSDAELDHLRKTAKDREAEIARIHEQLERETSGLRKDVARLQQDLEAAVIASSLASTRALKAERDRSVVEENARRLRDELSTVFAHWQVLSPSKVPPAIDSKAPLAPNGTTSSGPSLPRGSSPSIAVPPPPPMPTTASTVATPLDDDWPESSPPPALPALDLSELDGPPEALLSIEPLPAKAVPPPLPAKRLSGTSVPSVSTAPIHSKAPSSGSTATAALIASIRPAKGPAEALVLPTGRTDLFEWLSDPETARAAAVALREHPEWLEGRPPVELVMALAHVDYVVETPVFELARAWEREPLARALFASFRDELDPKLREHGAWLLKHFATTSSWPSIAELVRSDAETIAVRRWLLAAIEPLVTSHALGWKDVGDLITMMIHHPDAMLRDGIVGVIRELDRSEDKRRLLLEILRTDDDEIVLSSAVQALTSVLPIDLDPIVTERLLGHPSPRVQRSVMEFVEGSKRATKQA